MKAELKDLIDTKLKDGSINLGELSDHSDLYELLDYNGSIHEIIDSNIDIYYYDLRKWAVDNYHYIEQAISEGLYDTNNFDYHASIQAGQYVQLQEQAYTYIEELYNELISEGV